MKKTASKPTVQIYENYTREDYKVWEILFNKRLENLQGIVAEEFLVALNDLNFKAEKIPNFAEINNILKNQNYYAKKISFYIYYVFIFYN